MPRLVEQYEIAGPLNEQVYGTLHKARDRKTNALVLLLLPSADWPLSESRSRLMREFTLGTSLLNKLPGGAGVQRTLDYVQDVSGDALVLGFFPGVSLDATIGAGKLALADFFPLAINLCQAVDQVHRAGLVHRNLRPGSFLHDRSTGQCLLVDFALATPASHESSLSSFDPVVGWAYVSPEQTGRLGQRVDCRSDYYSLGMVLYALLSGGPAFPGAGRLELIHAHLAKVPPRPEASGALADLILKLLEKAPEKRYQSMTGLIADLERCRDGWLAQGTVPVFELAAQDRVDHFQISQSSFGRDRERQMLRAAYAAVSGGAREVLLVTGPSGVGKSTLIHEMGAWVLQDQGLFLQGKFDQTRLEQPYGSLVQAIDGLVAAILRDKRQAWWRAVFEEELLSKLAVLGALAPSLREIVGPLEPPPSLPPQETEHRLLYAVASFLKVLLDHQRPVVFFLDDIQWIDPASEVLFNFLAKQESLAHLMLIAASRDAIEALEPMLTRPALLLGPMEEADVLGLVASSLGNSVRPLDSLARVLREKTGGNHFFVGQLFTQLHQDGILFYDRNRRGWDWNQDALAAMAFSDNVSEFLISRFRQLPPAAQRCLSIAAALGPTFSSDDLGAFADELPDLGPALGPLVEDHYLVALADGYLPGRDPGPGQDFRFQHDRIRQFALDLLAEAELQSLRLKLARKLWLSLKDAGGQARLGETASLFLTSLSLVDDPMERLILARLFLMAGTQARDRSARSQALEFFRQAKNLSDTPRADALLRQEILFRLAEMCYLSRRLEEAEALSRELLGIMRSDLEKADVYIMQIDSYAFLGETQTAIEKGMQALRLLGHTVPIDPNPLALVRELVMVTGRANLLKTEKILQRTGRASPRVLTLMRLLGSLQVPANLSKNNNFPVLLILKATDLALRHGNNPESAQALAHFAILLSGLGQPRRAYEFGKLAIRLGESFPNPKTAAHVHNVFNLYCLPWSQAWKDHAPAARRSAELARQCGDQFTLAYESAFATQFNPDLPLDQALEESLEALKSIADIGLRDAWVAQKLTVLRWRNLIGDGTEPVRLSDDELDFGEAMAAWKAQGNTTGMSVGYIWLLSLQVLFGETDQALETFGQLETVAASVAGSAYMAEYTIYAFLLQADLASRPKSRGKVLARMKRDLRRMKTWAATCPANFAHWVALMEAEIQAARGRIMPAGRCWERALVMVEQASAPRDKAIVHERAAAFHLEHGYRKLGAYLMREAYQWYEIWGACRKGRQLEQRYPELALDRRALVHGFAGNLPENADTASLVKITQAVSREMDPDKLLPKVTAAVVESAGAERGWLLQPASHAPGQEGGWSVAARCGPNGRATALVATPEAEGIPQAMLNAALKGRDGLLIHDAQDDPQYTAESRVRARAVRSVLCLPFGPPGGEVSGIWYLENNLIAGAFSAGRLEVLKSLSGQIAISLENARNFRALRLLNRTLEQRVEERTAELQERNRQFMNSIEYAAVLQHSLLPRNFGDGTAEELALFAPRDAVGGDLYWFQENDQGSLLILVDCTGHGVPGALITVVVHSILREVVAETSLDDLPRIARQLNSRFRRALGQDHGQGESNDGFDIGACWWSVPRGQLKFLGAHIGLFVHDDGGTVCHLGSRISLGYPETDENPELPVLSLPLRAGSVYLMTTDGALGQTGGPKGIAFGRERFGQLMQQHAGLPLAEQADRFRAAIEEYRGTIPQLDDMTIVGFKIKQGVTGA